MSKTVIVTGGAGGIGSAVSSLFSKNGYNVIIGYNSSENAAKALKDSLASNTDIFKADVSDIKQVEKMFEFAYLKFGSVDVLVNNAGVSYIGLITDITNELSDKIFDTNLKGTYNCSKVATKYMVSAKNGKIINIASMWGEIGASCEVAYSASKAGVIGLTKALAKELSLSGITVNAVSPGLIDTKMNSNVNESDLDDFVNDIPISRMGSAEEIAKAVYFLASDSADYITGQILSVNGGYTM